MEFKYTVEKKYNGNSIHEILKDKFQMSSILLKKIRLNGNLFVNGQPYRMIDKAHTGDEIIAQPSKNIEELKPFYVNRYDDIPILFEDEHIVVLNKPANIVVHPTFTHPENTLIDRLSDRTLHTVTRLDRETSGAMIIAKHSHAHYRLMQSHARKIYWAITHGIWPEKSGEINAPIHRSPDSIMIRQVDSAGKEARTLYKVLAESISKNYSWVEFELITGRTHQIRVHSLYKAHPLLGDGLYGIADYFPHIAPNKHVTALQRDFARIESNLQSNFENLLTDSQLALDQRINRQALHARTIGFHHPITQEFMEFEAEIPVDMKQFINDETVIYYRV